MATLTEGEGIVRIINDGMETVPLDRLSTHPRNVNQGDIGRIHESVDANGFYGAIVAQRSTGHVLAGNHRLMTAQQAGASEIPVIWVDVDDAEALRILLADNRTTRLGQDDPAGLADLLQEILADTGTLVGTGFDADDLDELLADLAREPVRNDEGDGGEVPTEAVTRPGDLILLGEHRLVCGDSTTPEARALAVGPQSVGALIFDPPFEADGLVSTFPVADVGAPDVLVFGDCMHDTDRRVAVTHPWRFQFVWDGVQRWVIQGRPLIAHKTCDWFSATAEYDHDVVRDSRDIREKPTRGKNKRGDYELPADPRGVCLASVFRSPITDESHGAEHSKPVLWLAMLIGNCTRGLVLDPFAGSGSSLIACERIGRPWAGVELNPAYCDVIVARWEHETGQRARRPLAHDAG